MTDQKKVLADLTNLFGDQAVTEASVLREHSSDWIGVRRWEKYHDAWLAETPLCVIKAKSVEDVSRALRYCNKHGVIVVPQSGRSGVCMGGETIAGSVALDGSGMNEILAFDEVNHLLTARCGTPLAYIEEYCNKRGYTAGHFPQSLPLAQIGGLVSTRSTGQLSTLYGGIEQLVVGLEAVLADGTVVRVKNIPRRAAGPELRELFIGSEGNIGYVTEVTIKIFKNHQKLWKRAYAVDSFKKGLDVIREIMQDGWTPAVVRLHDEVEAAKAYGEFLQEGDNILLFVADGPEGLTAATGNAIDAIANKHGVRDLGEKPVDLWYTIRNLVCNDPFHAAKEGLLRDTAEVSALWSDIYAIYENVLRRFPHEVEDVVQISAHSSHSYLTGTNLYFVFSWTGKKDFAASRKNFDTAWNIIMEETLRGNGSVCHHHGVGKYRAHLMPREHGSAYRLYATIKEAFDPRSIMNIGTFLPYGRDK